MNVLAKPTTKLNVTTDRIIPWKISQAIAKLHRIFIIYYLLGILRQEISGFIPVPSGFWPSFCSHFKRFSTRCEIVCVCCYLYDFLCVVWKHWFLGEIVFKVFGWASFALPYSFGIVILVFRILRLMFIHTTHFDKAYSSDPIVYYQLAMCVNSTLCGWMVLTKRGGFPSKLNRETANTSHLTSPQHHTQMRPPSSLVYFGQFHFKLPINSMDSLCFRCELLKTAHIFNGQFEHVACVQFRFLDCEQKSSIRWI